VLQRDIDGEPMSDDFSYRSVIGKANFLEKSTRPDIAVAIHQCARFSSHVMCCSSFWPMYDSLTYFEYMGEGALETYVLIA
jgi:hypothetical protein